MAQKESQNILDINHFLNLQISKEKELQEMACFAAEICDTEFAVITVVLESTLYTYCNGLPMGSLINTDIFCKQALEQFDVLVINDAAGAISFYAGAPLTTLERVNMGTICVYDRVPKTLDDIQRKMLQSLSRQVVNLLEFDSSLQLLKEQFLTARDAEIKLRGFFESSSSCHLLLDKQLRVISFNKAMVNLMFRNHEKTMIEGMDAIQYVHGDWLGTFLASCELALTGKSSVIERYLDYKSGRIYWYFTFDPAYNANDEIVGVSFNATDTTKNIENEEQVLQHNEWLQRIAHIQANDLLNSVDMINEVMNGIHETGKVNHIFELQLLNDSVKELGQKSSMIINGQ